MSSKDTKSLICNSTQRVHKGAASDSSSRSTCGQKQCSKYIDMLRWTSPDIARCRARGSGRLAPYEHTYAYGKCTIYVYIYIYIYTNIYIYIYIYSIIFTCHREVQSERLKAASAVRQYICIWQVHHLSIYIYIYIYIYICK